MCEAEDIKDGLAEETDGIQSEREEARDCVVVTTAVVSSNVAASPAFVIATTMCVPLRVPLQALPLRPSVLLVLPCLSSLCWTPLIRRNAAARNKDRRSSVSCWWRRRRTRCAPTRPKVRK